LQLDFKHIEAIAEPMRELIEDLWPELVNAGARRQVRATAGAHALSAAGGTRAPTGRQTQTDIARSHYYGSDQAKPVARAAFLATRLTPAPVFRTALFADFMAFAVLDFLRFAIFVPLDSRFVELGPFLHWSQAVSA
jgi:hypothetical protein